MPMTRERLDALAACYGADPRRWPAAEQAAAVLAESSAVLEAAARLDAMLDAAPPAVASAALRDRILASGPRAREGGWSLWPRSWFSTAGFGAGFAAAACAGVMLGASLTAQARPADEAWADMSAPLEATAFGLAQGEAG